MVLPIMMGLTFALVSGKRCAVFRMISSQSSVNVVLNSFFKIKFEIKKTVNSKEGTCQ
jgi:hypothetical protein